MWVVYLKERVYDYPMHHRYFYDLRNAEDYAESIYETGRAYWSQIHIEEIQTED